MVPSQLHVCSFANHFATGSAAIIAVAIFKHLLLPTYMLVLLTQGVSPSEVVDEVFFSDEIAVVKKARCVPRQTRCVILTHIHHRSCQLSPMSPVCCATWLCYHDLEPH